MQSQLQTKVLVEVEAELGKNKSKENKGGNIVLIKRSWGKVGEPSAGA